MRISDWSSDVCSSDLTGEADDAEEARQVFASALLGPVQRRPLRIRVDQRDALSPPGPFSGEVERQRRLADAALLIEERDDPDALRAAVCRLSAGGQKAGCVRKIP